MLTVSAKVILNNDPSTKWPPNEASTMAYSKTKENMADQGYVKKKSVWVHENPLHSGIAFLRVPS